MIKNALGRNFHQLAAFRNSYQLESTLEVEV